MRMQKTLKQRKSNTSKHTTTNHGVVTAQDLNQDEQESANQLCNDLYAPLLVVANLLGPSPWQQNHIQLELCNIEAT